ncbi:ShlB/FhaC/HecB family hemolysin secretion/activation protein, partial [Campylobacter sp. RKI_CA19_01116]|nr:ShlB/FhaC/HecB family hemolysin secretion/activation protein [Campylobacter sp. RKI_CA19_01116]
MKKLLFSTIALSSLVYANNGSISIAKNDIEKVIELSPDRNLPQNKAIKENLKTKDDYIKSQEAKKDFEEKKKELKEKLNQEEEANEETNNQTNDTTNPSNQTNNNSNNNTTTTKKIITKYKFVITNENTSFEKLGIKEEDLQLLISEF